MLAVLLPSAILRVNTVLASGTSVGCTPGRSDDAQHSPTDLPYYRFDGWNYPSTYPSSTFPTSGTVGQGTSGPTISGVYSTISAYANYSYTANQDYDWQWVMLTNDVVSGGRYAQVGPMTGYQAFNIPTSLGLTYSISNSGGSYSDQSQIVGAYTDSGGGQHFVFPTPSLLVNPGVNIAYTVLYNNQSTPGIGANDMSFWWNDGTGPNLIADIPSYQTGWTPTQAQVNGETHTNSDQMYGDVVTPVTFAGTNVWYTPSGGSAGWHPIDTSDQATIAAYSKAPNGPWGTTTEYGWLKVSATQLDIWDIGCPSSVNGTDTLPVNNVLDSVGNGTQHNLTSGTPNLTNGPYQLVDQTSDGNLVLYDHNGHAVWSPLAPDPSSYLQMQGDDNLVFYHGAGRGAWFASNTGTSSYASPYAVMQNDGNLSLYGSAGRTNHLWDSATSWDSTNSGLFYGQSLAEGHSITSPTNGYHLDLDSSGNLYLRTSGGSTVWSNTGSGRGSAVHLDMQGDGNLVLYKYAGPNGVLWYTGTSGTGSYDHMIVGSSGTFSVYDVQGGNHWTS